MRFEYLGVLDAPMNLLYYCIRFCLNNYGDLIKEIVWNKKTKDYILVLLFLAYYEKRIERSLLWRNHI